ncbi:helix-turn-helix transcriptional regulator [Nocardia cyriacigeorgica]|uniref:Helix-turn-helix transcriptional regulator n=1 Tax=Nocardia cyriacigeorgica TaxID=135487 RepID=A0A6P1CKG6_9NOCA|nr:helix-turn-helix transcriptional regulator [Nocardia cyriacigeorgica]MBF6083817.1 helix-turn-helix domain-containing protein [Nocardia cyriacigeorgica]NEW33020.1 helix-turn-helix transcriptional regulator [Nocardia cyriacigeorgica]
MTNETLTPAWETRQFQELLASGQPGRALALVRRQLGLSQADFGDLLHWERTHVGRVERCEVGTIFDLRELTRATDALGIPRTALLPLLLGAGEPGTIENGDEGADDMDRRQFGRAASITAVAITATGAAASDPVKVGAPHIAHIQNVTRKLWEHDNRFGGGSIAKYAIQQSRLARRLLDHGEYGPRTRAELATATGWLSNSAAWLARDCGRADIARQLLTESVLLAEEHGDTTLLAACLGDLANVAITSSTLGREPVRLAQRAAELVRSVSSSRLNALRAAEEAIAHAAVGDTREFERSMTRVWLEVDHGLDSGDDPAWLDHVTVAELRALEARGRKLLGQHHKASDLYRESVDRPGNLPRDEASYRTYYAASLAGLGDTTSAVDAANSALSLLENTVNSPRLLAELHPVHTAARHLTTDTATHFRHRYTTLMKPRTKGTTPQVTPAQ